VKDRDIFLEDMI